MFEDGIISEERVQDFGEVFTPDSVVCDMLSMVDESLDCKSADEYISKVYLEPSCGDGQFLVRILARKMEAVKRLPVEERAYGLIKSLASIYGIDIQVDNVDRARSRMLDVALGKEVATFDVEDGVNNIKADIGIEYTESLKGLIEDIINANVCLGNSIIEQSEIDETSGNPEKMPVILKCYHLNMDRVSIAECFVGNMEFETGLTEERHWTELGELLKDSEEVDF